MVSAEYVSTDGSGSIAVSGQSGSVNVSVLNLRSGASTDSSVVGALYMGDTVSITESNNGWYGCNDCIRRKKGMFMLSTLLWVHQEALRILPMGIHLQA